MSEQISAIGLDSLALSDIAHVEMGQSPDSRYVVEDPFQGLAFLQGNAEFGAVYPEPKFGCLRPAKRCKANDVLISVRAPVGAINIADRDYCIGRGLAAIRAQGIKPSLLGEVIVRQSTALRRVAQGTTFEAINKKDLLTLKLNLPPKTDWSQLAEILDTLDTAIHEAEAIIGKLKAVKQGLLQDLLTRGIDVNGELRPPQAEAPHLYKQSPLGWVPQEWDFAPLVSKIDFPEGQVDPRRVPYRDWVLIAPDHIESGTGRLISTATAAEQQAISGKYVFQSGDVIYSKIRPYLRKAVLASDSGLCSADMYPLRPKTGIDSRYLLAVILGDHYSRFAESVSMRSGFPKINRKEMAEFSIGWPSSDEQSCIARILSDADIKQRTEEDQLEKLRLLKVGLMDDLLTGRVRVTPLLAEAAQQPGSA